MSIVGKALKRLIVGNDLQKAENQHKYDIVVGVTQNRKQQYTMLSAELVSRAIRT